MNGRDKIGIIAIAILNDQARHADIAQHFDQRHQQCEGACNPEILDADQPRNKDIPPKTHERDEPLRTCKEEKDLQHSQPGPGAMMPTDEALPALITRPRLYRLRSVMSSRQSGREGGNRKREAATMHDRSKCLARPLIPAGQDLHEHPDASPTSEGSRTFCEGGCAVLYAACGEARRLCLRLRPRGVVSNSAANCSVSAPASCSASVIVT